MSKSTPCYYTKGVDSCFHDGCRDAYRNGDGFADWMEANGDPCSICGEMTFERCEYVEDCDEVVHESCGSNCGTHENKEAIA